LGFLKGKEKVVVGTNNNHVIVVGDFDFLFPIIGSCAFYLYVILGEV